MSTETMQDMYKPGITLEWGLRPVPAAAIAAWGARAIFQNGKLELLPDRQSFHQGWLTEKGKERFMRWVNKKGLPKLRKYIKDNHWQSSSSDRMEIVDGNNHIAASCNASFGYCYILCWYAY